MIDGLDFEMTHTGAAVQRNAEARDRIALTDSEVLRWRHPDVYSCWADGALEPWRVKAELGRLAHGSLADLLDVPSTVIDLWERGLLYPSRAQFCRLSALTNIKPVELLTFSPGLARVREMPFGNVAAASHVLRRRYDHEIVKLVVSTEPCGPGLDAYFRTLENARKRAEAMANDAL
jgi:hypothetical protein